LDEIGDMPYDMQSKLLRVLQENEVEKIGATKAIPIDVRVIAATRQNLNEMVLNGTFREDLYYRLNVVNIEVTPLRDRKDDIVLFADYFLRSLNCRYKTLISISDEVVKCLINYNWPGNVREFQNVLERAIALTVSNEIAAKDIMLNYDIVLVDGIEGKSLKDCIESLEKKKIIESLKNNKSIREAAKELDVTHTLLINRMKKYDIDKNNI
ncbi:MAG TPA: AAA family ATPase, partial [Clostridiales bacterium]|nr:AAA family ATPase [Clostridiales bacterium]